MEKKYLKNYIKSSFCLNICTFTYFVHNSIVCSTIFTDKIVIVSE